MAYVIHFSNLYSYVHWPNTPGKPILHCSTHRKHLYYETTWQSELNRQDIQSNLYISRIAAVLSQSFRYSVDNNDHLLYSFYSGDYAFYKLPVIFSGSAVGVTSIIFAARFSRSIAISRASANTCGLFNSNAFPPLVTSTRVIPPNIRL